MRCRVRRALIAVPAVAATAAAASLALGACGSAGDAPLAASSGHPQPVQSGAPQAGPPPGDSIPVATQPTPDAGRQPPQPGDMLASVLDPLVEDGTLTSVQASAVTRAIAETMPQGPAARAPPDTQGST